MVPKAFTEVSVSQSSESLLTVLLTSVALTLEKQFCSLTLAKQTFSSCGASLRSSQSLQASCLTPSTQFADAL
jgi:hypothetical protein